MIDIRQGDCREIMAGMKPDSIDACITDPPYGLSFMGKGWDRGVPGVEFWQGALRVLKPGAWLFAFGGTRTHHRLVCAIENAGFEIRDEIQWLYGQGFPKSHNLPGGLGTALKPAQEPICVARKPLAGTVAQNLTLYGTGALNIDAGRVDVDPQADASQLRAMVRSQRGEDQNGQKWGMSKGKADVAVVVRAEGRWPANVVHDGSDEVLALFPDAAGQLARESSRDGLKTQNVYGAMERGSAGREPRGDAGSAARFFYCAKPSRSERGEGNNHPTVKPVALMRWLVRLAVPVGGVVLDPFAGSGTTGLAAQEEGRRAILCELNADYVALMRRRLGLAEPTPDLELFR